MWCEPGSLGVFKGVATRAQESEIFGGMITTLSYRDDVVKV